MDRPGEGRSGAPAPGIPKRRWVGARSQILAELRSLFTENLGYKLVSLLFAVFLWGWVQSEQVVVGSLPVQLRWALPEGMVPLEPLLAQASVEVEGLQAAVRSAQNRELVIEVDLEGARSGEATVELGERTIQGLPEQVRARAVTPASLRIQLDRASRRNLPVRLRRTGEVEAGFAVRDILLKPEVVEVSGPASVLRGMDEIRTDPVDLSGLREDLEVKVGLELRRGLTARQRGVTVTVDVEAERGARLFDAVPVQVVGAGWAAEVGSVSVILEGPTAALSALDAQVLKVRVVVPPDQAGPGTALPGTEGLHYVIDHAGGAEVRVQRVEPERIPIRREAEPP